MNRLLLIASAVLLSGCFDTDDERREADVNDPIQITGVKMPNGLQDCKIFRVFGKDGFTTLITRCPHSVTSTSHGKGGQTIVAEDEEETEAEVMQ